MLKFKTFEELLENEGLKKKSAKSGISYGTLKKVYNRGMAAWRTGHRPGTTPQQWGMARVNSYIGKGKGTYYGADADLSGKGKKKKESVGEALDKKDVKTVKKVIKGLKGAVKAHAGQVKTLTKDIKDSTQVKKEAMSDAEKAAHQKAIDAFKAKGGKIKKLKPGYAAGYHGKSDPGAGMKGMISPADTKQFGTKKKIGSMK